MTSFQKRCIGFIRQFVERRVLDKTGRGPSAEAKAVLRREARWMERAPGLAAALLVSPGWQDGPLPAREVIREYACRTADVFSKELIKRCSGPSFPPSFEMLTFVPMIELLLPEATAGQRRLWIRAAEACARASSEFLLSKESAWGKPGPYTGCGPNHLFIIAAPLYRLGRLLGDARHSRLARRAMHALCALQTPDGYFPENSGPVVGYHRVDMFGLRDYHATSGDRFVEPFLDRGFRYLTLAMYPNSASIETIDQRNRGSLRVGQVRAHPGAMDACLTWNPVGRLLAERALAGLQEQLDSHPERVPFHVSGQIALAALLHVEGPTAKALPCERKSFIRRIEDKAVVVRRDGWAVVLSGYYESNRPGNPFVLDRTQNVSVFNDRFGLIVGGGNDKRNFDAATFEAAESGYVYYFPPIGGRTCAAGRTAQVDLDYGAGAARLTVVIRSANEVELVAGLSTTFSDQVNWLNLQIPVGPGATVRIDGRRIKLSKKAAGLRTWPVKRRFEPIDGVCVHAAGGGEFRWPVLPFNSYNIPTHTSAIGAATGYLRLSLSGKDLAERSVRIRVRGGKENGHG